MPLLTLQLDVIKNIYKTNDIKLIIKFKQLGISVQLISMISRINNLAAKDNLKLVHLIYLYCKNEGSMIKANCLEENYKLGSV